MKNILIPTDFSENGTDAFKYALEFVGEAAANFHILNVVVPVSQSIEYPPATGFANQELLSTAKIKLDKVKVFQEEDALSTSKIKIASNVVLGRVADAIKNEAENVRADLIIMGTTGKGKSSMEKILGSVSSEVIRDSKVPVLLVPKNTRFRSIDNLVYATDLDTSDSFYIWKLSQILSPNTAVIRCLHVLGKHQKKNDNKINEFSHFLEESSPNLQTHFYFESSDNIEKTIAEFAGNYDAELIVMHRSAKSFWKRLFGPSHTKKMSYHLEVPLLIM